MTDSEKKRMISVVRAAEYFLSESLALKTVLLAHRVARSVWEPEVQQLMKDPLLTETLHAKFQHLYDEIEQSRDESTAFEALLAALPKPNKFQN